MKKIILLLIFVCSNCLSLYPAEQISVYDGKQVIPVAVIGSGVAGLSAAYTAAKRGYHTVVFQGEMPLGDLNFESKIRDWMGIVSASGREIVSTIEKQAIGRGVILQPITICQVDFSVWPFVLTTSHGARIHALSVIVATGTIQKRLHVPGEEKFFSRGVFMDVSKKDRHWAGKHVCVVGSGYDAYKKTQKLLELGAQKVSLLVRGSMLKIDNDDIQALSHMPKVSIFYNTTVDAVCGDDQVSSLTICHNGIHEPFSCDGVVIAIGRYPNTELFRGQLEIGDNEEIMVQYLSQKTSVAGVCAAGHCVDPRYQKGFLSAADGLRAGYDATDFLREKKIYPESLLPK